MLPPGKRLPPVTVEHDDIEAMLHFGYQRDAWIALGIDQRARYAAHWYHSMMRKSYYSDMMASKHNQKQPTGEAPWDKVFNAFRPTKKP